MNSAKKKDHLNLVILMLTLFLALQLEHFFPGVERSSLFTIVILLTGRGVYEIFIRFVYFVITHSDRLMILYWGPLFLRGYWSYEYHRGERTFVGIWWVEQDLDYIKIVGTGLNHDLSTRTIVRSVSPLLEDQGAYFVLNVRTELQEADGLLVNVYSKTTLLLDPPTRYLEPVTSMRGTTEVFGGPVSGQVHSNVVFTKHSLARSNEQVIESLKRKTHSQSPGSQLRPT